MKLVCWNVLLSALFTLCSAGAPKQCAPPPLYPHTRLDQKVLGRKKFNSGDKVYYNCAEDFTPFRGSRSVQCNDGKWTKLSLKCEKRSCGNAGDLPNGHFDYEGNSYIGEKAFAVCNRGYTLKGLNYMICKRSGWTGDFPVCVVGGATCVAPAVSDSVASGNVSSYRPGDNVSIACVPGFHLDGAQQITCGADGQWQPRPPQCLRPPATTQRPPETTPRPSHNNSGCGVPRVAGDSNANLADKYITRTSFSSGEKVYYVCDVGYTPAGGSRTRLCENGEWTPLKLTCERKLCGSAGEIDNGEFLYSGVEFGDTATAVCNEGFVLVGRGTRNCLSGGWDGRIPFCEAVDCDEPPRVKNAEMKGLQEPPYYYRSVVRYQCHVGTLVGQKEIWCTKHGTWSDPAPECKEVVCPAPDVKDAYWTASHKRTFEFRETISIECRRGFVRVGPKTISCNREGQWEPRPPRCQRRPRRV